MYKRQVLAILLNYLYFVPLSVNTIAMLTLAMFPVVYSVMGPISSAAKGYFAYELLKKREEELKEISAEIRSKAPSRKPIENPVEEARVFTSELMMLSSRRLSGSKGVFAELSRTLEDKSKELELKREKRFFSGCR